MQISTLCYRRSNSNSSCRHCRIGWRRCALCRRHSTAALLPTIRSLLVVRQILPCQLLLLLLVRLLLRIQLLHLIRLRIVAATLLHHVAAHIKQLEGARAPVRPRLRRPALRQHRVRRAACEEAVVAGAGSKPDFGAAAVQCRPAAQQEAVRVRCIRYVYPSNV